MYTVKCTKWHELISKLKHKKNIQLHLKKKKTILVNKNSIFDGSWIQYFFNYFSDKIKHKKSTTEDPLKYNGSKKNYFSIVKNKAKYVYCNLVWSYTLLSIFLFNIHALEYRYAVYFVLYITLLELGIMPKNIIYISKVIGNVLCIHAFVS